MNKYLFLSLAFLGFYQESFGQIFKLKSLPASGVIFRKEGGSSINIDILNTMPMSMNMSVRYTLKGKNAGAVVASDISNISAATDTINFSNNDTVRRFSFSPVLDNVAEGNDTFIFKLTQAITMGTIGSPDSIIVVFTDSVVPPITGRPLYSIGTIRGNNKMNASTGKGTPDSLGINCTVRGVLYGVNWKTNGYEMSICDGTGCMGIYSTKIYSNYSLALVKEGDSVEISGYIGHFNGLAQIGFSNTGDTIRLLGSKSLNTPIIVTDLNEFSESKLVKMDNLILSSGTWLSDSAFNLKMKDASGKEFSIRINNKPSSNFSSIPLIKSGKKYSIVGLGDQFDVTSGDKITGYQLSPRRSADIVETGSSVGINGFDNNSEIFIYPTITSQSLNIKMKSNKSEIGMVRIVDLQGRIAREVNLNITAGENYFTLSNLNQLPSGNYFIQVNSESISFNQKIIIQ